MPVLQPTEKKRLFKDKALVVKVVLALVMVSAIWAGYIKIGQTLLRPLAIRELEDISGSKVEIENVSFKLSGRVSMQGLKIHCTDGENDCEDLLKADELRAKFSLVSLVLFRPKLSSLRIKNFEVNTEYDCDAGQWNFAGFKSRPRVKRNDLPKIKIKNGLLRYRRKQADQVLDVIELPIEYGVFSGEKDSYKFSIKTKSNGEFAGSEIAGSLKTGETNRLELHGRVSNLLSPIYDNSWDVRDINLITNFDSETFHIENISAKLGDKTQLVAKGDIKDYKNVGKYSLDVSVKDLTLCDKPKRNCLVYSKALDEKLGNFISRLLRLYMPVGRGDVRIVSKGQLNDMHTSKWQCDVKFKDLSFLYHKFPYKLERVTGDVAFSRKNIEIKGLKGWHGDNELLIEGYSRYERSFPEDWECMIKVKGHEIELDEDLYQALKPTHKRIWFSLSPSGKVDVDYVFRNRPGEGKSASVDVDMLDCKVVYEIFPYPLQGITGKILIDKHTVKIKDVVGGYNGSKAEISGSIDEIASKKPIFDIDINASNVAIDETLRAGFSGDGRAFYDQFEVDGKADFQVKVDNEPQTKKVHFSVRSQIDAERFLYKGFGPELVDVTADVEFDRGDITIYQFDGKRNEAELSFNGQIFRPEVKGQEPSYSFDMDFKNARFDDDFLAMCPVVVCDKFKDIDFKGSFDLSGRLEKTQPKKVAYDIKIDCHDNTLKFKDFAYPLRRLNGQMYFSNEKIALKNMSAAAGEKSKTSAKANLNFEGEFDIKDGAVDQGSFSGSANRLAIGEELINILPENIKANLEKISADGTLNINVAQGKVYKQENQKLIKIDGRVDLMNGSFLRDQVLRGANASAGGYIIYRIGTGLESGRASLNIKSFDFDGKVFKDIQTNLAYDHEKGIATTKDFVADLFGGKIAGGGRILKNKQGSLVYVIGAKFDKMAFEKILAQRGDDTVLGKDNEIYGIVSGDYYLEGIVSRPKLKKGRLNLLIKDVEFGSRSLAANMVDKLKAAKKDYSFRFMKVDSVVKGNTLELNEIFLIGDSISFKGSGEIDLLSKDVQLDFIAHGSDITEDPDFAQSLANAFGGSIAEIKVRGNLGSPKIEVKTLGIFKGN